MAERLKWGQFFVCSFLEEEYAEQQIALNNPIPENQGAVVNRTIGLLILIPALLLAACGGGTPTNTSTGGSGTITTPDPTASFSLTVTVNGAVSAPVRITSIPDGTLIDQETVTGHATVSLLPGSYLVEGLATGGYPAALSQMVQGTAGQTLNTTLSYALAKSTTLTVNKGDGLPVSAGTTTAVPFTLALGNPNALTGKVTFTGQNLPAGVTIAPLTKTYSTAINTTDTDSVQVTVAAGTVSSIISGVLQAANTSGTIVTAPFKLFVQPVATALGSLSALPAFVPAQQGDWLAYFNGQNPTGKLFQIGGTAATFQFPNSSPHTLIGSPSGNALVFGAPASSTNAIPVSVVRSDGTSTNYMQPQSQYPIYPVAESDDRYWVLNNVSLGEYMLQRWSLSSGTVTASQRISGNIEYLGLQGSTDGQWLVMFDASSGAAFRMHTSDLKFESVRSGPVYNAQGVISKQGQACFFGTHPAYPTLTCTSVGTQYGLSKFPMPLNLRLIGFDAQVSTGLWISIGSLVERIDTLTGTVDVAVQYASAQGTLGISGQLSLTAGLDVIEQRADSSLPVGQFYFSHLP